MTKALLFDLDDTLLENPVDVSVPAYFRSLSEYTANHFSYQTLIDALLKGTRAMERNDGTGPSNAEAFTRVFYRELDCSPEELDPVFERFYLEEYPKLSALTRPIPAARKIIEWAFAERYKVVIATNPLYPRIAVEQRLSWAGVPVSEFEYDLVTSFDNMRSTKAHPAYYREISEKLDLEPGECLMVGDDWERDIVPASSVGMNVYWIRRACEGTGEPRLEPGFEGLLLGSGDLDGLMRLLGQSGMRVSG